MVSEIFSMRLYEIRALAPKKFISKLDLRFFPTKWQSAQAKRVLRRRVGPLHLPCSKPPLTLWWVVLSAILRRERRRYDCKGKDPGTNLRSGSLCILIRSKKNNDISENDTCGNSSINHVTDNSASNQKEFIEQIRPSYY